MKLNVAGLAPVKWENRRMHNIDLTDVVGIFLIGCICVLYLIQQLMSYGDISIKSHSNDRKSPGLNPMAHSFVGK